MIVVKFRGKVTEDGSVKVPRLTGSHVTDTARDVCGVIFVGGLGDVEVTRARLANMRGAATGDYYWPGWVDADTPGFTVEPVGSGFMADVTAVLDQNAMRRRASA